jgi:hypothetical protein
VLRTCDPSSAYAVSDGTSNSATRKPKPSPTALPEPSPAPDPLGGNDDQYNQCVHDGNDPFYCIMQG